MLLYDSSVTPSLSGMFTAYPRPLPRPRSVSWPVPGKNSPNLCRESVMTRSVV